MSPVYRVVANAHAPLRSVVELGPEQAAGGSTRDETETCAALGIEPVIVRPPRMAYCTATFEDASCTARIAAVSVVGRRRTRPKGVENGEFGMLDAAVESRGLDAILCFDGARTSPEVKSASGWRSERLLDIEKRIKRSCDLLSSLVSPTLRAWSGIGNV